MGLSIPMLDQCCCGCSLKTGTTIIGWFSFVRDLIILVTLIAVEFAFKDSKSIATASPDTDKGFEAIVIILAILYLLLTIVSLLLLFGTYKERHGYMSPWIILSTIGIVIEIICIITDTASVGFSKTDLQSLISVGLTIYFLLVVYSYYREIKGGSGVTGYSV
ncbi:uncharacterized protein LOC142331539 [Lycorma delicatula]|uniref:uncharacterized protein LOC142331539 n=1 Tax=Lycorma delicatula TaxID=130591 RepID=UPI003F515629